MKNYYSDSPEWKWLFHHGIDWDKILPLYYPNFPTEEGLKDRQEVLSFLEELLIATGRWGADSIAKRARKLDEAGCGEIKEGQTIPNVHLQELFEEARQLEYHKLSASAQYGGMGAPAIVRFLAYEHICRACLASASQMTFYVTIADMIERFGNQKDKDHFIPKLISGEISGFMSITESEAGSDVGNLRTKASKQEDGNYLINGTKTFITNGGGDIGFVLARIEGAPESLAGISLFLVARTVEGKQNFYVSKIEEKMGQHGCFTCEVVYENSVGSLMGEENQGFRYMLHLMNQARIGIGMQAIGGMEACIGYAREYAENRVQFGKPIASLPLFKRNLEEWETQRDAFRCLVVDSLNFFDIYQHLDLKKRLTGELTLEEEKQLKENIKWLRRRTPLVKYYGAEMFVNLSQHAIAALGGYGYMKEYDVERLHRDSFGVLLYEGTSQIQSLMALKDLLKFVIKSPLRFFGSLFSLHPFRNTFRKNNSCKVFYGLYYPFKKNFLKLLLKTLKPKQLSKLFSFKHWTAEERINELLIHAQTICQALCYLETLRVLSKHADQDHSRQELFKRYLRFIKPKLVAIYEDWKL